MRERAPIKPGQVAEARRLMRDGRSLQQAAIRLGVMSRELDRAIWSVVGIRLDTGVVRPHPMF